MFFPRKGIISFDPISQENIMLSLPLKSAFRPEIPITAEFFGIFGMLAMQIKNQFDDLSQRPMFIERRFPSKSESYSSSQVKKHKLIFTYNEGEYK
jgi:hypothetical protein